jgi:L-threonylcarbamoyladenylate synthase
MERPFSKGRTPRAHEFDMPEVVDWRCCQPSDVVQRAVELLRGGRLVAFPTDTGYELAASCEVPDAVAHLHGASERPLTLAATGAMQLTEWVPQLSRLGRRLARSSWPGPLTILAEAGTVARLPLPVDAGRRLFRAGGLAFRAPAHDAIQQVLPLMPGPGLVALTEVGPSASAETLEEWGDHVAMVIDDGPAYFGRTTTVVRLDGESWEMIREGTISAAQIEELSRCRILFVCTGNTCRSPLAQALCGKLLADRLGCAVGDLPGRGFIVQSAGLAAMMGGEAAAEAAAIASELGADLSGHRSQPLTSELLLQTDFLFVMTRSHLQMLSGLEAQGGPAPRLLSPRGDDIPDPIGSSAEVYRECARVIAQHLEELLPELQTSNA